VSEQLQISKDTLRYYDKLKLVCPKRGGNNYRHYTEQDILDLQYIQVLSFTGFTLPEIGQMFQHMRKCDVNDFPLILDVLKGKKEILIKQVTIFQSMIEYIDEVDKSMKNKNDISDISKINTLAAKMFEGLKELREELK
jgi:DNA-binding transcriptional MerR regulator